jgi:titin
VAGVEIRGGGSVANQVDRNFIGTDTTGSASLANLVGVFINGTSNNTIGGTASGAGNLISGNSNAAGTGVGVQILGFGAAGNLVVNNFIGTDATGEQSLGNNVGALIAGVSNNTIGGTAPTAGNVISGNSSVGVYLSEKTASNNQVLGNLIGTNAEGDRVILLPGTSNSVQGRADVGVLINDAPDNLVGGPTEAARNVISGFKAAVDISGANATGNQIQANFIGTDLNGEVALGNTVGVYINGVSRNTIGGTASAAGNVISGNQVGISLFGPLTTANLVQNNWIGIDASGKSPLGNQVGVFVDAASSNTIGGPAADLGNVISANQTAVYFFDAARGNLVEGNLIGTNISGGTGRGLGNSDYGVLLFNAPTNTVVTSGAARNTIRNSGIASVREFTGRVTQGNPRRAGSRQAHSARPTGQQARSHPAGPSRFRHSTMATDRLVRLH